MATVTRATDAKARVSLPKSFANATVIIERVSDTELRIRKARVIAEDDLRFTEEGDRALSARDRDAFLAMLEDPPTPKPALVKALAARRKRRG